MSADTPLLDEAHVEELVAFTSDAFIRRLIDSFIEGTDALMDELQAIDPVAAPEALRRKAHAIKSSAGNVGAKRLADLAAELEHMPADTDARRLQLLVLQIRTSYTATVPALRRKLAADSTAKS